MSCALVIYPASNNTEGISGAFSTTSDAKRQWLSFSDSVFRQVNHRWAYPSVMAFVTQGMNPQQSGQRERNDTQTVGMLLDLVRTLAPKFQKNLMP